MMGYNKAFVTNHPLTASFTSDAQLVEDADTYAIQLAFTGSPCSFTVKLQASSDHPGNDPVSPANYDDLSNSSQSITSAGTFTYNVGLVGYTWIRLVVTDNSGGSNSGVLTARINVHNN